MPGDRPAKAFVAPRSAVCDYCGGPLAYGSACISAEVCQGAAAVRPDELPPMSKSDRAAWCLPYSLEDLARQEARREAAFEAKKEERRRRYWRRLWR